MLIEQCGVIIQETIGGMLMTALQNDDWKTGVQ